MEDHPLWYKDAIIYELHVRAFFDSDGDGIGDFQGLAAKLDYLQDLGVTAIWLLPFYPSPQRDDGYDISDYENVNPAFGKLSDFKYFLREAKKRGLHIITELVLNHTSDEHPWFKNARKALPGTKERNFYVWSETPEKYKDSRIIFKDYETANWEYDPVAKAYFWHRFYSHQPDLNFDNPAVRKAMLGVLDFWLGMGVDGLRLDAVPYLFEREGTSCENLSETHRFLKDLRKHVDRKFKNRMLLAEANQWPEDAVAYFGQGDECHMAFHFPIMPRLFMAIHMEDRFPIVDILQQTPEIPDSCQWAIFLRNHDELTLEMVTDEERDYMYRVYAHDPKARINLGIRRRLAPLLGNHRRKIELMNGLLFSLPGTPVIYYGDELGMGDNIHLGDRNGVRTPMQWSADRNAGFSRANPQKLYLPVIIDPEYDYGTVNVEAQQGNTHSLLWWMKRLIALRKRYKAFSRGSIEFLSPENGKVLVFIRKYREEQILVIANLSRFVQCVEIDLSAYKGMVPVEMFGHNEFPSIGELPYFVTLGPHSFYWFSLETAPKAQPALISSPPTELKKIVVKDHWTRMFKGDAKTHLESLLPDYIRACRWFAGKARKLKRVQITEAVTVPCNAGDSFLVFLKVEYAEGEAEYYLLPVAYASGSRAGEIQTQFPLSRIAQVEVKGSGGITDGVLYEAIVDRTFTSAILDGIHRRRRFKGTQGVIQGTPTAELKKLWPKDASLRESSLMKAEQSNTSINYGGRMVLKLFRKIEEGINPDFEMGRYLTENTDFVNVPRMLGSLEYSRGRSSYATIGVLQEFVKNQGDAWQYTLDALASYFDGVFARPDKFKKRQSCEKSLMELAQGEVDSLATELVNPYLETARLLGKRTAELHIALAGETDDPAFAPEPFQVFYQRSLYQSMRNLTNKVFQTLAKRLKHLPAGIQPEAKAVLEKHPELLKRYQLFLNTKISSVKIRHHGDLHLGQILYTGKDFVFIDFEGEPMRSAQERRSKLSPLRDVAGILRSFHYAAYTVLAKKTSEKIVRPKDVPAVESWAYFWYMWVSSAYLRAYLDTAKDAPFIPRSKEETAALLDIFILEKAVYELNYELNNRPEWTAIPLKGITRILEKKV
ncbi:MAG: Trehalose synthase/amylase TreS [Candidatus Omnitrophica bacterium ADurb.Bin292]|nr:MAG: Trehalose synthase/amylase TreS [Candidatus Omnitrophica bacterium ADurb.Bin292]HPW76370.1 maltose alpha-D-glucosyltransferase [Candidatus Omnitrophota bacterium]HQB11582.1 maltose alpha-D-glucosyltransferase [Candidatus Omnitrophota bacterium]